MQVSPIKYHLHQSVKVSIMGQLHLIPKQAKDLIYRSHLLNILLGTSVLSSLEQYLEQFIKV